MSHPHKVDAANHLSQDGAAVLAARISAYWRERGADVALSLHSISTRGLEANSRLLWCIRSDLVDGLPKRK